MLMEVRIEKIRGENGIKTDGFYPNVVIGKHMPVVFDIVTIKTNAGVCQQWSQCCENMVEAELSVGGNIPRLR